MLAKDKSRDMDPAPQGTADLELMYVCVQSCAFIRNNIASESLGHFTKTPHVPVLEYAHVMGLVPTQRNT